jgi:hypothetical protein
MMLYSSIALFVVGVLIALSLASKHLKSVPVSIPAALSHGVFVASGLVLFLLAAMKKGLTPISKGSLTLFVIAALGGLVLFIFHLKGRKLPPPLIFVHALVAVGGFVLLLLYTFKPAAM